MRVHYPISYKPEPLNRPVGATPQPVLPPTHFMQVSAINASVLYASGAQYTPQGTIIGIIRPLATGSTLGGVLDMRGAGAVWLAILPGSPDALRLSVNIGGGLRTVDVPYTPGDAALYAGNAICVWGTWSSGAIPRAGWGRTDSGLVGTGLVLGATAAAACEISVGNVGGTTVGTNRSLGGEFEAAYYDRILADSEINEIADALTLANHAPGDAKYYPRPSPTLRSGDIIDDPATQVIDETLTWALTTLDGTSKPQAIR